MQSSLIIMSQKLLFHKAFVGHSESTHIDNTLYEDRHITLVMKTKI